MAAQRRTTPRSPPAPPLPSAERDEPPPMRLGDDPAERHATIREHRPEPPSMSLRAVPAESVFAPSPSLSSTNRSILGDSPAPPLPRIPMGRAAAAKSQRLKPAPSVYAPSPPPPPASRTRSAPSSSTSSFVPPRSISRASLFYQPPPARSRRPYNLHNTECGVRYKSTAKLTKADMILITDFLMKSNVFEILMLLSVIYHSRNNTIHGPNQLSQNAIRGIFGCDLIDYQFSLNELYKRFTMRKGILYGRDVNNLNFWKLPQKEVIRFMDYLDALSYFDAAPEFKLWTFGKDEDGKLFLKLKPNRIVLNYFQFFNSLHDSLYQWRNTPHGEQWIKSAASRPSTFYIG